MGLNDILQTHYDKQVARIEEKGGSKYDLMQQSIDHSRNSIYGGIFSGIDIGSCVVGFIFNSQNVTKQKLLDDKRNFRVGLLNNSNNSRDANCTVEMIVGTLFTYLGYTMISNEINDVDTTMFESIRGYMLGASDLFWSYCFAQNAKFKYLTHADSSRVKNNLEN